MRKKTDKEQIEEINVQIVLLLKTRQIDCKRFSNQKRHDELTEEIERLEKRIKEIKSSIVKTIPTEVLSQVSGSVTDNEKIYVDTTSSLVIT